MTAAPIASKDGRCVGFANIVRDVSQARQSQRELAELNASLEHVVEERTQKLDMALRDLGAILDAVPSMIGYWDRHLVNRVANKAYSDWFGVDPAAVRGMHLRDLLGDELFEQSRPYAEAALRGEAQIFERVIPRRDRQGSRHALVHYLPDVVDTEVRGFYVLVHDVSELVEGRLKLAAVERESEALLRTIQRHAIVSVADSAGRITEVNDNFCRISGFGRSELLGQDHRILASGIQGAAFWSDMWRVVSSGESWRAEVCNRAKDGSFYWVNTVIAPFVGASGIIEKYVAIQSDITARKKAEEALVHERHLMSALLDSLPDQIYFKDSSHRFLRVNPGLAKRLGVGDPANAIGKSDADFYAADHAQSTAATEQAIMASGEPVLNLEEQEFWPDRPPTWNLTTKMVLRGLEGRVVGTFGISRDISLRKQMEEEVRLINERFSLAADSAGLGVWEYDISSESIVWDDRMYKLYGRERSNDTEPYEVWSKSLHADDKASAEQALRDAIDGKQRFDTEFRILRPDGSLRHVKATGQVVRDADGRVFRMTGVNIDVTDRARAELELHQTMAMLNAVLASATQSSIIAVKPDGLISVFNAGAERLLGYRADEVVGRETSLVFHDRDEMKRRAEALSAKLGAQVRTGMVLIDPSVLGEPQEWVYRRKDGAAVPVSLAVTAMRDAAGQLFGYLGVAHDISGQKAQEQLLRNAMHQANQANSAKGQFLANMSHEIRTPMNAVIGLSYLLERTTLNTEQAALLAKIRLASKSLLNIINDVLDLSKIEASEMRVERAPFSLASMLSELSTLIALQAEAKGIEFTVDVAGDLPAAVEGDSMRLHQVLTNLLSNAIKFTERGSVRLGVHAVSRTSESIRLQFVVQDSGIGIEAGALARLFSPFVQADSSTTRRFGGTGLGLSIVKQLVALMGGEIGVSSVPGEGSRFWFELDFSSSGLVLLDEISVAPLRRTGPALARVRVLVVDDSDINQEVAKRILEQDGATVFLAGNGQEAVDHLLAAPDEIDVVLMDLQMPVLDGYDAARRIRAGLGLTRLPIIALTAGISAESRERAFEAGMDDMIGKPFDPPTLVGCILRHVRIGDAEPVLSSVPEQAPPASAWPMIEGIDESDAAMRLGEDPALFLSLLGRFLKDLGDFDASGAASEPEEVAARMHKLKGISGMLGATRIAQLATLTEAASCEKDLDKVRSLQRELAGALQRLKEAAAPVLAERDRAMQVEPDESPAALDLQEAEALLVQLRQSDLGAFDRFARLGPQFRGSLGPACYALLQDQIESLRFSDAAQLLEENLGRVVASAPLHAH